MGGPLIAVSDANVLIDLEVGGLIERLFCLPGTALCIPDLLFEQELRSRHAHLLRMGLALHSLTGGGVASAFELAQRHGKLSRMDLFALQLAREKRAVLLSGDKALRKVAALYHVVCHGTIWLVERMVEAGLIEPWEAEESYSRMREAGSRLPWAEATERLALIC